MNISRHETAAIASFIRMFHDRIAQGHRPPDDDMCDFFIEETDSIAASYCEARDRMLENLETTEP